MIQNQNFRTIKMDTFSRIFENNKKKFFLKFKQFKIYKNIIFYKKKVGKKKIIFHVKFVPHLNFLQLKYLIIFKIPLTL